MILPLSAEEGVRFLFGWQLVASLPAIFLIVWLAQRLLGARRSVAMTFVAGLAGWVAGAGLSLIIAEGDPEAPGFTRNVWVFAVIFSMSASAWIELLARPGALARAQAGLTSVRVPCGR